jgi:diguanylate cyclase (GGDEF)-like protein
MYVLYHISYSLFQPCGFLMVAVEVVLHFLLFLLYPSLLFFWYHFVEMYYPEMIIQYPSNSSRMIDLVISFFMAGFLNYFILKFYITHYYDAMNKLSKYSKELEDLVDKDSMTMLYNHATILGCLDEEINRAKRYKRSLSILMLDIDDFKHINDTYGHQFGDRVIITLSNVIKNNCRSMDIAGRYGGEEFLIVFPETDAKSALVVGERIRDSLAKILFMNNCVVTFSAGLSELKDESAVEFVNKADELLYKAKSYGKNQIQSRENSSVAQVK